MDTGEDNGKESNDDETKAEDEIGQERDRQEKNDQFDCTRHINVKDKLRALSKKKEKTISEENKAKHEKEPTINVGGCLNVEKAENCELPPMVPKGKEMSQEKKAKHSKEPAYNIASSSKGVKFENSQVSPPVQPMAPPMHFPSNGYGSFNQGYPIFPNFSGSPIQTQHNAVPVYGHNMHYPFYHHNDQLPIYPQGPQLLSWTMEPT